MLGHSFPTRRSSDLRAWDEGSAFTVRTLWPRLADISFNEVRRIDVPIIFLLGRHDYTTPAPIAAAWLARVRAPRKLAVWFEHSAHLPMIEEPGRMFATLLRDIRPLARDARRTNRQIP